MPVPRRFFNSSIEDLEALFDDRRLDLEFLKLLEDELRYRTSKRSLALATKVSTALKILTSQPPAPAAKAVAIATPMPMPQIDRPVGTVASPPVKPASSTPADLPDKLLDAWTVLEVLSPQGFRRPEDLVSGERRRLADIRQGSLPWLGDGEKSKPNHRLYYQIVLGTIDLEAAFARLLDRYSESGLERPAIRGEAIAASITLDQRGKLIEAPAATVASFAWAFPQALSGDLGGLSKWPELERQLVEGLDQQLRPRGEEEKGLPIDRSILEKAWRWLIQTLRLPEELVQGPRLAVRCYEYFKHEDPPEPLILNSFYLGDLARAKKLFAEQRAPFTLRAYFGCQSAPQRAALLKNNEALERAVSPLLAPAARWPGSGRHSLVLLQQAAVNLGFSELKEKGIFAVNGPPGTGKTTLLRDFFAGVVTSRAEVMAQFEDPAAAFRHSGEKLRAGASWLHLYRLDERLHFFEMVVASSNNKAVENVSEALPDAGAIASELGLSYFRCLSDSLLGRSTWGLAAAVLGNAANRARFRKTFWWDPDVGMSAYLAEAAGHPQQIEIEEAGGKKILRSPRIITEEDPPLDPAEARARWQKSRKAFLSLLAESRRHIARLEEVRQEVLSLPVLKEALAQTLVVLSNTKAAESKARERVEAASADLEAAQRASTRLEKTLEEVDRLKPGIFARLFKSARARNWLAARAPLESSRLDASRKQAELTLALTELESQQHDAAVLAQRAAREQETAAAKLEAATRIVEGLRQKIGFGVVDDRFFFDLEHEDRQKAVPWLDRETQLARDAVFAAAMNLHRAFADVAAKPIRHNLGALMNLFGGARFKSAEQRALLADLWRSLFLVVPLVSTTFASVERMLGDLPPESLGWLFVDEAGQALPQQAVGALMRVRRAVVVGDPVQIEPVVTLPGSLTHAIFRTFHVDADRFGAPAASVQTLADSATRFYAEFHGRFGTRTVGMPLLVHRRCADPMFGIANAVAYDHQMVQTTPRRNSPIGQVLGPSAFFDVRGSGAGDKWSPEEGITVLGMLRRLATAKVPADLYLISPFVVVAENLRRLVREAPFASAWLGEDPAAWTREHVGTVHTVQGREAEAVIFVLGAPNADQNGARAWAGGQPNLLNVAVTRAKERLYVVGNRQLWREAGLFRELDARLP